jgi:hypothetical protein
MLHKIQLVLKSFGPYIIDFCIYITFKIGEINMSPTRYYKYTRPWEYTDKFLSQNSLSVRIIFCVNLFCFSL